jgi:hypothetical protein
MRLWFSVDHRLGAFKLSVLSTVLVFAVIPLAVIGIVAALVLGSGAKGQVSRRYRPGRPYDFQPIWFLAAPERVRPAESTPAVGATQHPALASSVVEDSAGERVLPGRVGGASDRW